MAGQSRLTPEGFRRLVVDTVPDGVLVVALSGGADSAALAWALSGRPAVRAMTVDHGLPGSGDLVAAARDIAEHLGLPHSVVAVRSDSSSETALRAVRLQALEESAGPAEWIVTGHTADDQAETVFSNLLRGAGPGGLAGIPTQRDRFLRPMLEITRADTRLVATTLGLPYVDDPQNDDLAIRRNRLRNGVLPELASEFNPRLVAALGRTASASAFDNAVLDDRAAGVPLRRDEEAVLVPVGALLTLPRAVGARVVRRALRAVDGPHAGESRSIEGVFAVLDGGSRSLPGGLQAVREGPFVAIAGPRPEPPPAVALPVPGKTRFGRWTIAAGAGDTVIPVGEGPIRVRAVRAGDRIAMGAGAKKVTEALREAGVPARLRPRWPVIEQHGRIAWVVGVRVAQSAELPGLAMKATREQG